MIKEYEFHDPSLVERLTRRSRLFTHALIISVAINLGLIATFSYFILLEKRHETAKIAKPRAPKKLTRTNSKVLEEYIQMSFNQLVEELDNNEIIEQGYTRADLALAYLVAFHYFDIERALPGFELQRRPYVFSHQDGGEKIQIDLIPGVDPKHFKVVKYFAKSEVWPLTPEGLFEEMKHRRAEIPDSLKEAFFMTEKFYFLQRTFSQFSREAFLSFLLEGSWKQMEQLAEQMRSETPLLGPLLTGYSSRLGAYMLISLDPDYAFHQLPDEQLLALIEKLDEPSPETEVFLKRVATSLRSDRVREQAEKKFIMGKQPPIPAKTEKIYIVQRGDSLWKLSRQFGVKIEQIRQANQLESDRLHPGQKLVIP